MFICQSQFLRTNIEIYPTKKVQWLRITQIQRTHPENPESTAEKFKNIYSTPKVHFQISKRDLHNQSGTKNNSKYLSQALYKGRKKLSRRQEISKLTLVLFYLHFKTNKTHFSTKLLCIYKPLHTTHNPQQPTTYILQAQNKPKSWLLIIYSYVFLVFQPPFPFPHTHSAFSHLRMQTNIHTTQIFTHLMRIIIHAYLFVFERCFENCNFDLRN